MTFLSTCCLCVIPLICGSVGHIWGWRINADPGSGAFTWGYIGYSIAAALICFSTALGGLFQYIIFCAAYRGATAAGDTLYDSVLLVVGEAGRLPVLIASLLFPIVVLPFTADSPVLIIALFLGWIVGVFYHFSRAFQRQQNALGP